MSVDSRTQGTLDAALHDARAWADRELDRLLPDADSPPRRLHEAMRYAVFGGGKRLRPALVRLVGAHFTASSPARARENDERCALPAAALECLHTYSLVHDDLPCMDDDDLRRGRPTCHKVYGEALAVLVGDALLTHAFLLVARTGAHAGALGTCLAEAAGSLGMVGGQAQDLTLVPERASPRDVESVHELKTAKLFAAACEMGAIVASRSVDEIALARAYGRELGLCFQAVDDVLDVTGDAATLGKTPGKDARAHKPTIVAALGLEGARVHARELAEHAREAAILLGARAGEPLHDLAAELLVRTA